VSGFRLAAPTSPGHTIQSADACAPGHEDWAPFRTDHVLDRTEAIDLCRELAAAPGSQPCWRVLDEQGRQVLRLDNTAARS
jgi:hypothetical protein